MISIFSFENTAKLFLIAGCCQKNVAIAPKKLTQIRRPLTLSAHTPMVVCLVAAVWVQ